MNRLLRVLLAGMLLAGSSCVTELPLPDMQRRPQLVLLGEFGANDTVAFRVGQSVPVSGTADPAVGPVPQGCAATVFQNGAVFFQSAPYADSLTAPLRTLAVSNARLLRPGNTYDVKVTGAGFEEASARVVVPGPFTAAVTDTQTVSYGGLNCLQVTLRIYDAAGEQNFYVVEALRQPLRYFGTFRYQDTTYDLIRNYALFDSLRRAGLALPYTKDSVLLPRYERLEMYTRDGGTENVKIATPLTPARRILRNDLPGGSLELVFYIRKDRFTGTFPEDVGSILILVKAVPEEYFVFLRAYESFSPTNGNGFLAQPVRIPGNVKGGLGVVGGVFAIPFRYFFEKNPV